MSLPPEAETIRSAGAFGSTPKHRAIVRAVIASVRQSGQPDLQMADIVLRSGVALKTIYRYYDSKELMLAAALRSWYGLVTGEAIQSCSPGLPERMIDFIDAVMKNFESDLGMARLMVKLMSSTKPEVRSVLDALHSESDARLSAYLGQVNPTDLRARVVLVKSLVTYAATNAALHGGNSPEMVQRLHEIIYLVQPTEPTQTAGSLGTPSNEV